MTDEPDVTASGDDLKEKFRQALDRKKQQHQDGIDNGRHGPDAAQGEAHSSRSGGRREFRRKAGG